MMYEPETELLAMTLRLCNAMFGTPGVHPDPKAVPVTNHRCGICHEWHSGEHHCEGGEE